MGSRVEQGLLAMTVLAMVLASLPGATAGTAAAPEIIDADDDRSLLGAVPLGGIPLPVAEAAELVAGWVSENSTALLFNIQVAGDVAAGLAAEPLGLTAQYQFEFHFTRSGADLHAAATIGDDVLGDGIVPGELATEATVDGNVIQLTVPKSALPNLSPGELLTALEVTVDATLTALLPPTTVSDAATGTLSYAVQFADGGVLGDADADGLADPWEQQHFGGLNETGSDDPDGDGLNNTREQALGTSPAKADTDGDGLKDGVDSAPLDPKLPVDSDNDGLRDAWEREHFGTLPAQAGAGDPDQDNLNNSAEQAAGTDPNVADTDGDGFEDGFDSAPLDPDVPGAGTDDAAAADAANELRYGAILFAAASTFILLGLARGI